MRLLPPRRPRGPWRLDPPRPDGTGFPDPVAVGRPSFEASATHELALRNAYEIEAHAVADRLVQDLLPRLDDGAAAADAGHMGRLLITAARVGAGLGMVARSSGLAPDEVDAGVGGALLLARGGLPAMPPAQAAVAGYVLLAGFAVARGGPEQADDVVGRLLADLP